MKKKYRQKGHIKSELNYYVDRNDDSESCERATWQRSYKVKTFYLEQTSLRINFKNREEEVTGHLEALHI